MTLLDPPQPTMQNVTRHTKLYSFMDHGYVSIGNECQAYLFQGGKKPLYCPRKYDPVNLNVLVRSYYKCKNTKVYLIRMICK